MNLDSYYEIGSTHAFCQDYAFHKSWENPCGKYHFAAISDGCSSAKNSEDWARYLPRKAQLDIQEICDCDIDFSKIEEQLIYSHIEKYEWEKDIRYEDYSKYATLLICLYEEISDELHLFAWGDGGFMIHYQDGRSEHIKISYKTNAPYYLNYLTDKSLIEKYETDFQGQYGDLECIIRRKDKAIVGAGSRPNIKSYYCKINDVKSRIKFISCFSDGMETFRDKNGLIFVDLELEYTNYKNTIGEFVVRRCLAEKRRSEKEGLKHEDDISIATIAF